MFRFLRSALSVLSLPGVQCPLPQPRLHHTIAACEERMRQAERARERETKTGQSTRNTSPGTTEQMVAFGAFKLFFSPHFRKSAAFRRPTRLRCVELPRGAVDQKYHISVVFVCAAVLLVQFAPGAERAYQGKGSFGTLGRNIRAWCFPWSVGSSSFRSAQARAPQQSKNFYPLPTEGLPS